MPRKEAKSQPTSANTAKPRQQNKAFYLGGKDPGITFWDTGRWMQRDDMVELIEREGGRIAEAVTAELDYVVPCNGEADLVEQVSDLNETNGASIAILDFTTFGELFTPDRETAIALLKGGAEGARRFKQISAFSDDIDLSGADFRDCDLKDVKLFGANVDRCDFRGATLGSFLIDRASGATFDGAVGKISIRRTAHDCSFRGCKVNLFRTRVSECVFDDADLTRAKLSLNDLSSNSFRGTDLSHANFRKCDLSAVDLSGAKLCHADLSKTVLAGANLSQADLTGANLEGADLSGATVEGANFEGAQVDGAYLTGVDASSATGLEAGSPPEVDGAAARNPFLGEPIPGAEPRDFAAELEPLFEDEHPVAPITDPDGNEMKLNIGLAVCIGATKWREVLAVFEAAVAQVTQKRGEPAQRVEKDSDDAQLWVERAGQPFTQLAAWQRQDGRCVYILADFEDRQLPMLVTASITD